MDNQNELNQASRINLWEKVSLILEKHGNKTEFLARVEDINKDFYSLELPIRQSGESHLEKGDIVDVMYQKNDAAYTFKASILDLFEGDGNSVKIERRSDTQRLQRRRFVRLDISGKMSYRVISGHGDDVIGLGAQMQGNILNISAGGVLFESHLRIKEGSVVVLSFSLKGRHHLQNILAVAKRCERALGKNYLIGAELITKSNYARYGLEKLENFLPPGTGTFDENLQKLVVQFIYEQQLALRKKGMLPQ